MKFYNNQPRVEKVIAIFQNILIFWRVLVDVYKVDECSFHLFTSRALVDQRAARSVAGSSKQNLNIIMAISPEVSKWKCHWDSKCNRPLPLSDKIRSRKQSWAKHRVAPIHWNCAMESVNHTIMLKPIENVLVVWKHPRKRLLNQRMAEIFDRQVAATVHKMAIFGRHCWRFYWSLHKG